MVFKLSIVDPYEPSKEATAALGFLFNAEGSFMEYYEEDYVQPTVEIKSLKGLLAFQEKVGYPIIVYGDIIEIYNGYRE